MPLLATAAKLALAGTFLVAAPVQATLTGPSHTPKINTHWNYVLHVTQGGKPVAAKITGQIVDPIGGVHPVQFGPSTKNITNWPIKGVFRDYIIWPPSSRGIPLKLRFKIRVGTTTTQVSYSVVPRK